MPKINFSNIFRLFIFLAFAALISISPSLKVIPKNLVTTSFHDSQRLVELILVTFVLLFSVFSKYRTASFKNNTSIRYMLFTLVGLVITSSCLALSPRHAFLEMSLFVGLSYLAIFVESSYQNDKTLLTKRLVYVLWAGVLLCMVSFYVGYFTAVIFKTPVQWPKPLTGFGNIRFFNQYQLWGLGLIALPLITRNYVSTSSRRWLHVGLSLWFVLLFFAASRGAFLALLFSLLTTALVYRKSAWAFIRLQLTHLTAGYLIYKFLFQFIPSLRSAEVVTGTAMRETTNDRIELWKLSLNLIQDHPYLGVGPMAYAWLSKISSHPHNSVLQLMTEWGLPAAFIVFALVAYGVIAWLRKFNVKSLKENTELDNNLAIILFFTLATSAAYSLVDGVIVMPISQVMMFTFVGLAMGFYYQNQPAVVKNPSNFSRIFAGIVLITLAWSSLPEILQATSGSEKHFSTGYTATGPRIWQEVK